MATENIAISKQYLLKAYREAEPSQKEFMKQLFGADTFASSVMERIKTFQDAVNELGYDNDLVKAYKKTMPTCTYTDAKDILAYLKLRIICAALNEGWEPKFTEDEYRYYPWFCFYSEKEVEEMYEKEKQNINLISTGALLGGNAAYGSSGCFGYVAAPSVPSAAGASLGSRLCLKSDTLALYCGKQFINIWADFNL